MEYSKPQILIDLAEYEELKQLRDQQESCDKYDFQKLEYNYKLVRQGLRELGNYVSQSTLISFNEDPTTTCKIINIDGLISVSYRQDD